MKDNTLSKFFYDEELLEKFETVTTPHVFALDMGLGKTQTLYHYIRKHPDKRILVIVNNTKQLDEMMEKLPSIVQVWHSKMELKFHQVMECGILGITKTKFFQLLLNNELEFLEGFNEYYYDEFSGLSPIAATELIGDVNSLANTLKRYNMDINYYYDISKIFEGLLKEINKETYKSGIVYNIKLPPVLRDLSSDLLKEYWAIRSDPEKNKLNLETSIIVLLKAVESDNIYMSKFFVKFSPKYALVVKTNDIKNFIKHKKFIVLDATAQLNKYDYEYLDMTLDSNFTRNTFDYSCLEINCTNIKSVKSHEIRNGNEESIDKLIQDIDEAGRQLYTFAPQKAVDPLVNLFGFNKEKLLYFFSGDDVGSNRLKDVTELNIIATQTYPKILRVVYNHVLYNYSLNDANNNDKDLAEWYMVTRDLIQLIGRTAVRKHEKIKVKIHIKQVDKIYLQLIKESHFKKCKINFINKNAESRSKLELLLELIKIRLTESNRKYVYIEDIVSEHFTSKIQARNFFNRNNKKIIMKLSDTDWVCNKVRGELPFFKNEKNEQMDSKYKGIIRNGVKTEKLRKMQNQTINCPEFQSLPIKNLQNFDNSLEELLPNGTSIIKTQDFLRVTKISKYKLKQYMEQSKYKEQIYIKGHSLYLEL
jgi:hypothetical protein